MRRRKFVRILVGAMAAWPIVVRAQQKPLPVIGYLNLGFQQLQHPFLIGFHDGLKESGFVDGENLIIEYRWAEEHYERLPALAADLVRRRVDVIVAAGDPAFRAAASASSTIPVVFVTGSDPVQAGLVSSLARPSGNLTGFTAMATHLVSKRLELLVELLPQARIVALLVNPNSSNASEVTTRLAKEAASAMRIQLITVEASEESHFETAFAFVVRMHADALIVSADAFFVSRSERIAALAAHYAVPAIYELRQSVNAGGLISYGPNVASLRRQAGIYAGKILMGAKPADLPIQQPTSFELVINLKTAKALDLNIPAGLLLRADEVIE